MARMDTDYEHDDLDVGKKPRVIVKKKGGWLGKIVALLLGIVIGIVAGIGGLVGAGYYIVTQVKIKDAANTVSGLAGFEIPLSDYLSDEYAEMTLLGFFDGTLQTLTKIGEGTGTLGDLNAISPFVGDFIENGSGIIALLADYGIETTAEELMSKYLVKKEATEERDDRYLIDYFLLKIENLPFAKIIESLGFEGNELITTLCYGVEGVDYEIQDGEYVMLGDSKALTFGDFMSAELDNRIEKLPLDSIMGTPQDKIILTLFYGASHRYTQTADGVEMNQVFYTYDGVDFYDDDGDKLDLTSATNVSGDTYNLTFTNGTEQLVTKQGDKYYAFTTDDGAAVLFPKTTIGDLQDATILSGLTSKLQLKDVMDVGENKILKHLGEETINDLPSAINSLTIDDVFGDQFYYRTYNPTTDSYTSYRENDDHQPIDQYGNPVEGVYMVDINNKTVDDDGDGIITREEADKALTGTWKYLLRQPNEDGTFSIDRDCTIIEMDGMMDHMSENVQAATIRELKLDGIVKTLSDETLNKEIIGQVGTKEVKIKPNGAEEAVRVDYLDGDLTDTDHVSDLTVEQLSLYTAAMLDIISEMP